MDPLAQQSNSILVNSVKSSAFLFPIMHFDVCFNSEGNAINFLTEIETFFLK